MRLLEQFYPCVFVRNSAAHTFVKRTVLVELEDSFPAAVVKSRINKQVS
jgi:hypothetical protein